MDKTAIVGKINFAVMALAKSISKQEEVAVIALCISSSLLFSTMLASFGFMWNHFVF